ncbi:hypothetical protein Tco_0337649, partial [Tanacetum coccineum]
PPTLEKGNYIPWESRFRRFLDNKLEEEERMWHSIEKGPYVRPMIPNPNNTNEQILEPLSKMIEGNKKQYIADVKVMNYLLQVIPNDIYNSVDACKNAKDMWERIKMLMFASKAKKAAKNHDPLALLAYSNASSSQSHENYSYSPQPYYVTHPSSVVDYEDEYQGELQGDSQEDKLTTAMMLLNHLEDGRVDIQTKNAGYGGNGHYARNCQKPRVRDAKYFREQTLLAMKDEAGSNLKDEENDFMLDKSYEDETLEELSVAVIMMARIQPVDDNVDSDPSYVAKAVSEVNASNKAHA